jgi:hippurate hydrolase
MTIDPVLVAMYVGIGLQSIVSRNISPMDSAVVSIGSINSGTVANIIPSSATMKLSIRSFSAETQKLLNERIVGITEGICQAMGATCEIAYKFGYPMMINNKEATDYVIDVLGAENVMVVDQALSGSEDFSYFLQKAPGTFFGLCAGYADHDSFYNHHPKFNPNEDALAAGVEAFVKIIMGQDKL